VTYDDPCVIVPEIVLFLFLEVLGALLSKDFVILQLSTICLSCNVLLGFVQIGCAVSPEWRSISYTLCGNCLDFGGNRGS
jgi:hypothetical protein